MKDAVGSPVYPGNVIAHVLRRGSSMYWEEKRVVEVHADHLIVVPLRREGRQSKITANHFVVTTR